MKKALTILLIVLFLLLSASCSSLQDLSAIRGKVLITLVYAIENDDVDVFVGQFKPSLVKNRGEELEQVFEKIRNYYQGNIVAFANQLTADVSTRGELTHIPYALEVPYEALSVSTASMSAYYYVQTDEDEYLLRFSWEQNEKEYGLTAIHIVRFVPGISWPNNAIGYDMELTFTS
ncbi:MAG: DUF5104 domain-containing protein [Clostridiales bacterium]|nr:DUF5104 domain-containing protein [Clostridiales bacterium]